MSSALSPAVESLAVCPVVQFPKEAEAGKTYLLTIDLSPRQAFDAWPYPDSEEVSVYCLINAAPLFSIQPLGEPAVVIHRFGGSYGPARFLITAAAEPQEGVIRITLVNGLGVPLTTFETPVINVRTRVESKVTLDLKVAPRVSETAAPPVSVPEVSVPDISVLDLGLPDVSPPPVSAHTPERSDKTARIFVSSTHIDLSEYRKAVYSVLTSMGHEVILMEQVVADRPPVEESYKGVEACDLYIGIFGWRYGYVPPYDNPGKRSITELEYRHALAYGKPCLIFMVDEKTFRSYKEFESGPGTERLWDLRSELKSRHVVNYFENVEQLAMKVSMGVSEWFEQDDTVKRRDRPRFPPLTPDNISISRLPVTGSNFFGREVEMEQLDEAWDSPGTHVVSLIAWGGVGKSALVNTWLRGMARDNYRGAEKVYAWSFYRQGTSEQGVSADQFIDAALRWFGDADPTAGSPWDKGERLAWLIKKQRTLLLLDGLEPLQYAPGRGQQEGALKDHSMQALLRELAALNPGLCVISSRLPVADLADYEGNTARRINLEHLSPQAGAEFLRAQGVTGTQEQLEQASGEYDGHPLSLALLGGFLTDVYGGDITRRAEIPVIEEESRYGPHAQRVLASYEHWFGEGPELAVLRLLGLFNRPASQPELAALRSAPVISGLTDALVSLSDRLWQGVLAVLHRAMLITGLSSNESSPLTTHPLVREHFTRQLRYDNPEAWREGHNRLYEYLLRTAKEFPDTIEEMSPLYTAIYHGCQAGRHQDAFDEVYRKRIQRGNDLSAVNRLGAFEPDLAALSNFFELPWKVALKSLSESSRLFILNMTSYDLRALGRLVEAIPPMRGSLEISLAQGDLYSASVVASNLATLHLTLGNISEALDYARQAVAISERLGDSERMWMQSAILGHVLHQAGYLSEAEGMFLGAERMLSELGRTLQPLFLIFYYNTLLLDQGRYSEVQERATRILQPGGSKRPHDQYSSFISLGQALLGMNSIAEASTYLLRAVQGLRQMGQSDFLPDALLACAELYRVTGDLIRARAELDEAMSIVTRGSMKLREADCHLEFARLFREMGEREKARESLERARQIIVATGYHRRDKDVEEIEEQLSEIHDKAVPIPSPVRDKVFIAYNHADKKWVDRLVKFLSPVVRRGAISLWDDTAIKPGTRRRKELEKELSSVKVAVLLVSANFLASDFIGEQELSPVLEAAAKQELKLCWVAISPSMFERTPLNYYQAVNNPLRPLSKLTRAKRESELLQIAKAVIAELNH